MASAARAAPLLAISRPRVMLDWVTERVSRKREGHHGLRRERRWSPAVAIQGDRKIVAAGQAIVSEMADYALASYTCLRRTSRPMSIQVCS